MQGRGPPSCEPVAPLPIPSESSGAPKALTLPVGQRGHLFDGVARQPRPFAVDELDLALLVVDHDRVGQEVEEL